MKLARFQHLDDVYAGVYSKNKFYPLPYSSLTQCMGKSVSEVNNECVGEEYTLDEVKLLPPVKPSKIICLGWNYAEHVAELKNEVPDKPMVFFKPTSALIGHEDSIKLPSRKLSSEVNNEVELAVVIGKLARNVKSRDALDHVLGYTVMQDITARDIQFNLRQQKQQWEIAKAFDTFAPLGPWIATTHGIKNPHSLKISLRVNDKVRQDSNTKHQIFKIPDVIEYLSSVMTLNPGDIISTGTPKGVDLIHEGDVLEAEIEKIGVLRNTVKR